ncbi:unnamed protein product, partial [marine sediment metagenome]
KCNCINHFLEFAANYAFYCPTLRIVVGFNEFCSPSLDDAFEEAIKQDPEKIIVITPMMTQGGEHSEKDIPEAIERAKKKNPNIKFSFVLNTFLSFIPTP